MAMSIHNCTSDRNRYLFNNEEDNVVFLSLQVLYSDSYYMYSEIVTICIQIVTICIQIVTICIQIGTICIPVVEIDRYYM